MNTAHATPEEPDAHWALRLRGAGLHFGHTVALDSITLDIAPGERVALVGPSGAGKSSLLSLANASVAPTVGTVEVLGQRPIELSAGERRDLRAQIGTVYQSLHLPGALRVVHNVSAGRLGRWSTRTAVRSLIRPVDLADTREALDSLGIGDKLWRRTDELSGGERQRVAIARVLVQRPTIVCADEPIASLDPARAHEVLRVLLDVSAGRTLVVSLHAFELAVEYFDRVIGLRAGNVVFDRSADELRRSGSAALATSLYDLSAAEGS